MKKSGKIKNNYKIIYHFLLIELYKRRKSDLAKESIRKIRDAEATAAEIIAEAEKSASDMLIIAEKRGRDHLETVTRNAENENRRKLNEIRSQADQMLESGRAEAEAAAKQLRALSDGHNRDAVKLILQGIFEQCQ